MTFRRVTPCLMLASSLLALCCKPRVAGPEEPAPADVVAYSHCAEPVTLVVQGPAGSRNLDLAAATETPLRLGPEENVAIAQAPEKAVAVRKTGGTIVVGSSCRTLIGSDLGGLDDPG